MFQIHTSDGKLMSSSSAVSSGENSVRIAIDDVSVHLTIAEALDLLKALTHQVAIRHIYDEDGNQLCGLDQRDLNVSQGGTVKIDVGLGPVCVKCYNLIPEWIGLSPTSI